MKTIHKFVKENIGIIVSILLGILSVLSLFHSGLPPTHDGEYHVIRFYEFDKALRDGAWYPIWAADLNYTFGSPLFNYVYPLPNYIASFFHLFGFSFIDSFKLNLITASILGALSSFLYGRGRFGVWGGIVTSVFYTFAPYRFLDIYIRGSVGEVWAIALFPLCLYLFDRIAMRQGKRVVVLSGMAYALVIFSHNILAVMFSVFLISYALLLVITQPKNKKNLSLSFTFAFFIGILLSAIFFFPALAEQQYVTGLKVFDILQNFPELYQLIIPSWGSGFSGGTLTNQMSFQIGVTNLLVIFLILLSIFLRKARKGLLFTGFFLIWFFILVFLITPFSIRLWENIPLMDNFQFPWRFLSVLILCTAILAGSLTNMFRSKFFYIFLVIFCILSTYSYSKAPYFLERQDSYYTTRPNFIYGTNSIGNIFQTRWLPEQKRLPSFSSTLQEGKVLSIRKKSNYKSYEITLSKESKVTFNTAYFPGWKAEVNGVEKPIINNAGRISVSVPKGKSNVSLAFGDTKVRLVAKIVSAITFLLVVLILFKPAVIQYFYAYRHR